MVRAEISIVALLGIVSFCAWRFELSQLVFEQLELIYDYNSRSTIQVMLAVVLTIGLATSVIAVKLNNYQQRERAKKYVELSKSDFNRNVKLSTKYYLTKLKASRDFQLLEQKKKLGQLGEIKLDEQDIITFSDQEN